MLRVNAFKARPSRECGRLPLPKGEGWGEGLQTIDRSEPPHPNPLPDGERESRRAVIGVRANQWMQPKERGRFLLRPSTANNMSAEGAALCADRPSWRCP